MTGDVNPAAGWAPSSGRPDGWPRCECPGRCACADLRSYVAPYRALLDAVRPAAVFEWGPGENTRIALSLPTTRRVVSVEQDPAWVPAIADDRFEVLVVSEGDDRYVDLAGHADFDVFFIDSRRRADCLDAVRLQAKPTAIACLHDAQRARYHAALSQFRTVQFLTADFAAASNASPWVRPLR